ncbi:MAG: transporter substrate-binding domain-containing protein [Streptosporangiales bacterium]|nr:transporter substrate-binding domain-containing protein [Streptosporangiales bacterium]
MHRLLRCRSLALAAVLALFAVLSACGGGGGAGGEQQAEGNKVVVKVGWVPTVAWITWLATVDQLDSPEFRLQLTDFKSSSDTLVSLTNGSIDLGAVGYNVLADTLGKSDVDLQYVAGASTKSATFIAGKDAGVDGWSDLKGKRVGGVRGSAEYVHLVNGLRKNGMKLGKDVKFVNFQSGTDIMLALQRGEVDATISYEPLASQATIDGVAKRVPAIQDTLFDNSFEVSSGILARGDFLEKHPKWGVEIIKTYTEMEAKLKKDPAFAQEVYLKHATGEPKVLDEAFKHVTLDYRLDQDQVQRVETALLDAGQLDPSVKGKLVEHLDYSFLEKATGKSPTELGKSSS